MKNLKNLGQALTKAEQKTINGNGDPISGFPGSGGSGNSGTRSNFGVCILSPTKYIKVLCSSTCPDGTDPICAF